MKLSRLYLSLATLLWFVPAVWGQTQIRLTFAEFEEASQLIMEDDHFNSGLSTFDICSRVGQKDATKAELKALQHAQVREWTKAEIDTLTRSAQLLEQKLSEQGFTIPVPAEVIMIKTTALEEGGSGAYTRENQIYIGQKALRSYKDQKGKQHPAPSAAELCPLLAHELFHVLTRNNRSFRSNMYKTIDFSCLDHEIKFADDIWSNHISNPDISSYDSYATFTIKGQQQNCTMILLANRPYNGGSFFNYLQIGLVPLDEQFVPMQQEGKTIVYGLDDAEDFYQKVGKNTGYVINPEECLADNFAIAVLGFKPTVQMQELPNPEIIDKIKEVLRGSK